jgi:3-hydroxyisobutyrate dehydrogenase-like beta-hydroxyacid dehydrogenase
VLGTKEPAEEGRLVVLASGPETARPTLAPVLDAIGSRTVWVGDFTPSFGLDGATKDASLILDAARASGADTRFLEVVHQHLSRALEAGHGDLDLSATYLTH